MFIDDVTSFHTMKMEETDQFLNMERRGFSTSTGEETLKNARRRETNLPVRPPELTLPFPRGSPVPASI